RPSPPVREVTLMEPFKSDVEYDIHENILMITSQPCRPDSNRAVVYSRDRERAVAPAYFNNHRAVYLFDLREEVPDSVVICEQAVVPGIVATVPSAGQYQYYSDLMDIQFPVDAI